MIEAGVWFALLAVIQTGSQFMLDSGIPLPSVLFFIFMDRMSRRSRRLAGVRFWNYMIAPGHVGIEPEPPMYCTLFQSATMCVKPLFRFSTCKSKAMVLVWNNVTCPVQVGVETLPQVGAVQVSRQDLDAAPAVMCLPHRSAMVKKKQS